MKKRIAVFLTILIFAFASIGIGLYLYLGSTKSVFVKAVTKSVNELFNNDSILKGINYNTLKIDTKTDISVVLDKDKYNASITGDVSYDKTTNKIISNLSLFGNNQKIVDFISVLDSSKLYVKIKELMTDYYYLDVPVDSSSTIEKADIIYLKDLIQKSVFDTLDEKDFTKTEEKITLDKQTDTKKISIKIDARKINSIIKVVSKDIKNDKKAMSIIQKMSKDFTEDDIDEIIKSLDDEINEEDSKEYIIYSIYIINNDSIVRHEFDYNNEYKLIINTYNNNSNYKNIDVLLNNDGKTIVKISKVGTSKTTSTLTITSDIISGVGTITKSDQEESITLKLNMQNMEIGTISASTKKISNKEYSCTFNIDAKILTYTAKINSTNKLLLNEKITDVDTKGAKDFNKMSKEEYNKIMSTIMTRIAKIYPSLIQ